MGEAPAQPIPVRRRLTLLRDGSTTTAELVFCHALRRTVPPSRCAGCGFAKAIHHEGPGRSGIVECVRCTVPAAEAREAPGAETRGAASVTQIATALSVGLCLVRPVVCVARDAPLEISMRALELESSAYGVAVVDEDGRLVGALPRARAALALLRSPGGAVSDHLAGDWGIVHEDDSLSEAFAKMTARHARELTVVGEGRVVVGVLRDIDALRFVSYVARTGSRPPVAA